MDFRSGDIFLTSSTSLVSRLIKIVLWKFKDPAPYSHIAGYVGNNKVIEALFSGVTLSLVDKLLRDKDDFMVVRMKGVSDDDRKRMADLARYREGVKYGFVKVGVLQLFDQITHTNFFTKNFSVTNRPYCSELWAGIYEDVLDYRINDVDPVSCEPDDWQDEVLKNPDKWERIDKSKTLC